MARSPCTSVQGRPGQRGGERGDVGEQPQHLRVRRRRADLARTAPTRAAPAGPAGCRRPGAGGAAPGRTARAAGQRGELGLRGAPEEGPVQRRDPVDDEQPGVPVEPVVPGQHRGAEVAHHQHRGRRVPPPVEERRGRPRRGSRSSTPASHRSQLAAAGVPGQRHHQVVGGVHALDHHPAAVPQQHPLEGRAGLAHVVGQRHPLDRVVELGPRARSVHGHHPHGATLALRSASAPGANGPPRCPSRCAGGCSAAGPAPSAWRTSTSRRTTPAAAARR